TNWSAAASGGASHRSAPGAGVDILDAVIAAKERVRRALAAAGPVLADVLIDVCGYSRGLEAIERGAHWPQRSGKVILAIALEHLVLHYGGKSRHGSAAGPGRIRHWGAEGYRPSLETEGAGPSAAASAGGGE